MESGFFISILDIREMKIVGHIFFILLIIYLCYLTFCLATDYQENSSRNKVPFIIWIIDTIDLFIHEAGHIVFRLFGRFVEFLGGSLLQVIIPVAAVIVFGKSNPKYYPFTLYWTGQSLINVSIYIGDAPFMKLHLISKGAIHDWRWLLSNAGMMENAGDIAWTVNAAGLITCLGGIIVGIYIIFRDSIDFSAKKQTSIHT